MKFLATAVLVGLTLAETLDVACPTVTKSILNPDCNKACGSADCSFVTTVQNPCGCPTAVPTATLLAPCEAGCPYDGCRVEYRSVQQTCSTTTQQTRRPRPTSSTSSTTSSQATVVTGITTLPPKVTPTTAACPTVTVHSQPADCAPLRCPVPTCYVRETMEVPCGCDPQTLLYVEGCSTVCDEGCATRTSTVSQECARATGLQ